MSRGATRLHQLVKQQESGCHVHVVCIVFSATRDTKTYSHVSRNTLALRQLTGQEHFSTWLLFDITVSNHGKTLSFRFTFTKVVATGE